MDDLGKVEICRFEVFGVLKINIIQFTPYILTPSHFTTKQFKSTTI